MKIDYDGIQYARECELNKAQAELMESLVDAMKCGDLQSVPISFEWVICDYCSGDGGHSRHFGVIDPERWDDWDDESRDNYMSGAYDTRCIACSGSGKVREINLETLPSEVVEYIENYRQCASESASERYYERLAGC